MKKILFASISFCFLSSVIMAQWVTTNSFIQSSPSTLKVGIGLTTIPTSKLQVNSATSEVPFILQVNSSEKLRVDNAGKMGLGTSVPYSTLHLFVPSTSGTPSLRLNMMRQYISTYYYHNYEMFMTSDANSDGNLEFRYGYTTGSNSNPTTWYTCLKMNSSGELIFSKFIDKDGPTYFVDPANTGISLKVAGLIQTCGKVEAEEIEVKNVCAAKVNVKMDNLADYVFSNDYKRMSLNELEQFIHSNKHLPGIPSAEKVKNEGMDVAEMNNLLLQKVEELTLYVIELKKENEALKKLIVK